MIWSHVARSHWKTEEIKPFTIEVKYIKDKDIAVWRVTKDGVVLNKGREGHVIEAMRAASAYAKSVADVIKQPEIPDFDDFKGPEINQ